MVVLVDLVLVITLDNMMVVVVVALGMKLKDHLVFHQGNKLAFQ